VGHLLAITIPSWSSFFQYVFSGLSVGCIYALVALGFVIIANVTGVYNFAQGDYVMVGGMIVVATTKAHWSLWIGVPLAVLAVAGVALVQERLTVAPIRRASPLALVVASLGFGVALEGFALLIWGKDPLSMSQFNPGIFTMAGAYLTNQVIWIWCTAFLLLIGVVALFQFTALGRAMRACAINPTAARLLGIRIGRLSAVAFVLGGALSGLVGAVTVPLTGVSWNSGLTIGLVAFIAAALAQFTNPIGAVVAGLSLGVIEALAAGMISSEYREAIVYGVLIVYLFAKDLFGEDGVIRRLVRRLQTGTLRLGDTKTGALAAPPAAIAAAGQLLATVAGSPGRLRRMQPSRSALLPLGGLVLACFAPLILSGNSTGLDTMIFVVLLGMGATGLGLIMGLAGQFSLGQGAMYLLSGYTAAILTAKHGWNPIAAMLVGVLIAVVAATIIGWLTMRLRGFNLAIATLAIQLILLVWAVQDVGLTGGPLGTTGIPPLKVFGLSLAEPTRFFYVGLGFLVLCLIVARNVTNSRIGRSLRAIGSDEDGAQSLGVSAAKNKMIVFILGAAMAGIGGSLWAYYLQFAAPSTWDVQLTINLIAYVIIGGLGSVYGPLIGTLVLSWMQYWISGSSSPGFGGGSKYMIIISGSLVVLFVIFFRDGVSAGLHPAKLQAGVQRLRSLRGKEPALASGGGSAEGPPP
jgi:branched-chain amino acid transport system permease protein